METVGIRDISPKPCIRSTEVSNTAAPLSKGTEQSGSILGAFRIALSDPEADLRFERQDNDLHMSFTGTNDGLRIAGWYERNEAGAATHQIERFQLADGRTLLGADIEPLIAAQSITGSSSVTQFWR